MKSTGVIRRIDELGRIVLPKEIRRNLGIRDGENLEIFVEDEKVVLKKFSKVKDYGEFINSICKIVDNVYDVKIIVTDRDKVIATSLLDDVIGSEIDLELINCIQNRESVLRKQMQTYKFNGVEKVGYYYIYPIISSIDCLGLVILYSEKPMEDNLISLLKLLANFIVSKVDIA